MQVTSNMRKHVTQMHPSEKLAIKQYIASVTYWSGLQGAHITAKKSIRSVNDTEVLQALVHGDVIEAHYNNAPDVRFVTRANISNRAVCVCANTKGHIVTAWVNNTTDNHRTLKSSEYQWQADLTTVFNRKG